MLADEKMKDININRLQFLFNDGRVIIYGFVIMPNHIHLIWQIQDKFERAKVQQKFLKVYRTTNEVSTKGERPNKIGTI